MSKKENFRFESWGNMKKRFFSSKLITAIFTTVLLLYFMTKTTSPKIIFVPFMICSISMAGKQIGLMMKRTRCVALFDKLFKGGFLLFLFGFLIVACYISIRDKNYGLIVFSLPFWLVGIYLVKKKLLNIQSQNKAAPFNFAMIVSAGLVLITLLAGVVILILGVIRMDTILIFVGAFFTFGAFTFILITLTALGYFDKHKIDVLGLYIGILFVVIGIGIPGIKYRETLSILETIRVFGFWILIPIMLVVVGALQIVKCLKNGK